MPHSQLRIRGLCFLAASLCFSCTNTRKLDPTGRAIGVLASDSEQDLTSLNAAIDVANFSGRLFGGQLRLERANLSDFESVDDAIASLAGDDDVWSIVSLLDSSRGAKVSESGNRYGITTVSPNGSEWWDAVGTTDPGNLYTGLITSTVGSFAALANLAAEEKVACASIGVVIRGDETLRKADLDVMESVASATGVPFQGAHFVQLDELVAEASLTVEASCVLVERGVHAHAAAMKQKSGGELGADLYFVSLRGNEEFRANPDFVSQLNGEFALNGSNGSTDLRNRRKFELLYEQIAPEGRGAEWMEHRQFDAGMILTLATIVANRRSEMAVVSRAVATNDSGDDVPYEVWEFPHIFDSAVDIYKEGATPDYRGVSGNLDFFGPEPLPQQRYEVSDIEDFVEGKLTVRQRLSSTLAGSEYELAN